MRCFHRAWGYACAASPRALCPRLERLGAPHGDERRTTPRAADAQSKRAEADKDDKAAAKRRQSRFASAAIPTWITKAIGEASVMTILAKMDDWDFDIFALEEATNGHRASSRP